MIAALACCAAGCGHPQIRLMEEGQLAQACQVQPFYSWYEAHSRHFSDAVMKGTDIRLRLSPLTDTELVDVAGKAPVMEARKLRRVVRLELEVRDLGQASGIEVELPVIFRGHSYRFSVNPWSPERVAALLPPLPPLELAERPRFKPGKPPERPVGVLPPNKVVTGVVQGFSMGLVKLRGRGPTRKELRQWRREMKAFKTEEAKRRAAHDQELARVNKMRDTQASIHAALVRVREALVARLHKTLAGECGQLSASGAKFSFNSPGRCVLHAPLTVKRDKHLANAAVPTRATLRVTPLLRLGRPPSACAYKRPFKLELSAGSDIEAALSRAFTAGAIRLQDFPPDPPPFD